MRELDLQQRRNALFGGAATTLGKSDGSIEALVAMRAIGNIYVRQR
jgi:hypothetical protein